MMPVTVLCNHAIVDGINIAQFYNDLDLEIQRIVSNSYCKNPPADIISSLFALQDIPFMKCRQQYKLSRR